MSAFYVNCDDLHLSDQLDTDICGISRLKWQLTGALCGILFGVQLYLQHRWKYRCHQTLLTFHNLRAALTLLLLAINTLELARAFLPWPVNYNKSNNAAVNNSRSSSSNNNANDGNGYGNTLAAAVNDVVVLATNGSSPNLRFPGLAELEEEEATAGATQLITVIVGSATLLNALLATIFTLVLLCYHRVSELKNVVASLYLSAALTLLIFMLRTYELAEITYDLHIYELEPCLGAFSALLLLALTITDCYTIYKERYRPVYAEDYEKIGYKHTIATFYSKACFWWLTPLLWFGYKEPLELEDLGQMRVEDSARAYYDRFLLIYKTAKVLEDDPPPSLWLCYLASSWRMFTLGGVLKLCGDLFALVGPLAIQQIVQYIETLYSNSMQLQQQPQHTFNNNNNNASINLQGLQQLLNRSMRAATLAQLNPYNSNIGSISSSNTIPNGIVAGADVKIYYASWLDLVSNGWAIAWFVLLAALAQGGLSQASTHILNMTGIRIKTSLQGLIYRKTLLLSASNMDRNEALQQQHQQLQKEQQQRDAEKCESEQQTMKSTQINANNAKQQQGTDAAAEAVAGSTDVGAITNLMTEDTLNIMSFFWIAHYVWAIPLKITVVMCLLYLQLGISAVIGSIVCILTLTPLQFLIGKAMSNNTEKVAKFTDERLRKIHDTLCGIKLIKLNAWDEVFLKKIRAARNKELHYLNKDSIYWTLMTILTHVSTVLITFVTLAVYVRLQDADFCASRLFAALALFQQLTVPLLIFPITVPIIIAAVVSTRRIERFLLASEIKKEFQGIRNMARILSKSDAALDKYEAKQRKASLTIQTTPDFDADDASATEPMQQNSLNERRLSLRIPPSPLSLPSLQLSQKAPLAESEPQTPLSEYSAPIFTVQPPSPCTAPTTPPIIFTSIASPALLKPESDDCTECKRKVLLRNTPYVLISPNVRHRNVTRSLHLKITGLRRDSLLLKMPENVAVSLREAVFAWDRLMVNSLIVSAIDIPRSRLTIIVGKNGSGKSSLLAALLMEMPHLQGDMIWNKTSTFAFVPQQPWLLNASIRQNILFGESFRPRRYDFVLEACALKPDIELMPEGDFTVIGERGLNLSGGQRQRVAIARALYSSANVVIMDDPLSSLDNEVARHIFEQSIRRMLLKANRTVILVTQQLNLVQQADYLIVMKDNRLLAAGSYKNIEAAHPDIVQKWQAIIAKAQQKEQQNATAVGRTARERWKLYKNVSKIGLQRSVSTLLAAASSSLVATSDAVDEIDEAATENDDLLPASLPLSCISATRSGGSYALTRSRSSVYGSSRHLIYDVPLPIDECATDDVVIRRSTRSQRRQRYSSTSSRCSATSGSTSSDYRRSQLTASCSSAGSSTTNNNNNNTASTITSTTTATVAERHPRVQSWQPQSSCVADAASQCAHKKLSRNISSPGNLQPRGEKSAVGQSNDAIYDADDTIAEDCYWAAAMAATADQQELREEFSEKQRAQQMGSFQQFMRRMSARRSNKSQKRGAHRPTSATKSILSISEESTSQSNVELSAFCAENSWLAQIEDEQPVSDANIDYKDTLQQRHKHRQQHRNRHQEQLLTNNDDNATERQQQPPSDASASAAASSSAARATPALPDDLERKYGKIPARIYLLYLRASGWPIVVTFFATALIWQCLRVYTDVWLQHWTDDNVTTTVNNITRRSARSTGGTSNIIDMNAYLWPSVQTASTTINTAADADAATVDLTFVPHEVTYYFRVYACISAVCILMAVLSTPAGQLAGCNARRNLHDQLLSAILRKSLHFFQVTPLGRIMNRFSNDMATIDKKIAATSQRLLQFTLLCLCAVLINVSITPWFILLTLPICVAYYAIQKFYRSSSRELQRIENFTNTPVISHLSETIQGVTTIRAYNQEARFTEILFRRLEANTIAFTILNTSNRWLGISLDYLGGVIVFVAIVTALLAATISCRNAAASYEADNSNNMSYKTFKDLSATATPSPSPSLVGLAINYTLLVPIYLNWVVKLLADMEMYVGSVERIAHYATSTGKEEQLVSEKEKEEEEELETMSLKNRKAETEIATAIVVHAAANECGGNEAAASTGAATDIKLNAAATDRQQQQQQQHAVAGSFNSAFVVAAGAAALPAASVAVVDGTAAVVATEVDVAADKSQVRDDENAKEAAAITKLATATQTATTTHIARNDVERRASVRHRKFKGKPFESVPISWPQRGDISFQNVSLRYEGQQQDVIKNLTLQIPAGQRIGICGRTGSGKSSLALSLFGVLQTTTGRILIDDVDITKIHPDEIRTRLSIIPQDVHLFNATIRENLDPPGYFADLNLWNCLELAQLKEFVNSEMPLGLDTEIFDGGSNLSAGHRQLFCLARAILRGSVCLVLDEATSSLDSSTERALLETAHKAFQGRTILTIAHRLSTILNYDRIIVLENGKIIEDGSPQELQAKQNGVFHALLHSGRPLSVTSEADVLFDWMMEKGEAVEGADNDNVDQKQL